MTDRADAATGNVGRTLGAFVAGARWDEVPAAVQHEAKRSILNGLGAALGAAIYPAVEDAVATVQPFAGPPQASVIGRPERFDILTASFVNAIGANAYDFDDTHLHTVIHPTAPVAPALLALAEHRGLAGADLLHAFVLGVEIECRLGNAVTPGHYARGWHITTTCGVFGAAAGSARLMGLDAGTTAHALGIAASQSGGIVENLAAGAKSIAMGNAARNGLLAALAAERGCTAAARAIEGPLGWARAAGDEVDVEELVGGLGARWELAKNTYKPYPCGIVLHPVIDACLALRQRHGIAAADVAGVIVNGHPLLLARADRPVANERDARISIHHSVAAVFLFAAAGLREYSDAAVGDAAAIALRGRVRAEADAAIPVGAARVSVRTVSGEIFSAEVAHARGSLELPMTDADIETKTRELAKVGCPSCDVARVIDAVWTLDRMTDVGELMALLRSARARRSD